MDQSLASQSVVCTLVALALPGNLEMPRPTFIPDPYFNKVTQVHGTYLSSGSTNLML